MYDAPDAHKLLLTPREAATALSVCEKTLWSLTAPRGDLPCVRLNRSVRYSVEALREWIADRQRAATTALE
jgi:predicted DNA-binding transcriptional regulator AlpA